MYIFGRVVFCPAFLGHEDHEPFWGVFFFFAIEIMNLLVLIFVVAMVSSSFGLKVDGHTSALDSGCCCPLQRHKYYRRYKALLFGEYCKSVWDQGTAVCRHGTDQPCRSISRLLRVSRINLLPPSAVLHRQRQQYMPVRSTLDAGVDERFFVFFLDE